LRIWRDEKLQGNDVFNDEILNQLRDTALLVAFVSPNYVGSVWCKTEIVQFCRHAQGDGGLTVGNKSRVFKVFKYPVDWKWGEGDDLPAAVGDSVGYEFYVQEDQGPVPLEPGFGESYEKRFLLKVYILARDVSQLLRCFEPNSTTQDILLCSSGVSVVPKRKTVVFLASCSYDLRDQREWIEADLRGHGYRVLPEQRLPSDEEQAHRDALAPLLALADLSIHLIGSSYGAVPDGPSNLSLVEIQNHIAAARSRSDGLKRLIWLPEGLSSAQPDQMRFLEDLVNEAQPQVGADLLRGSMEELRTVLHSTLDRMEIPRPSRTVKAADASTAIGRASPDRRLIYVICVPQDRSQTSPLRKWLMEQGYEVLLPALVGDAAELRKSHEDLLRDCCGALIFYGAGGEAWHRSVALDLRRAPLYRDGRPLPPPFTFLAAPNSDEKDDMVKIKLANVVDERQVFSPELLLPFLEGITGAAT
jgi:hypothetical protein